MSNIFQKWRKKRKRAKMMAQNGKLSQDVGSEEGYRRQLSMHKIAAMKKTVLTVRKNPEIQSGWSGAGKQ